MAKAAAKSAAPGDSYLAARPKYLVVFKEPSSKAVTLMSKVLDTGEARGVSTRASCTVLGVKDQVHTRVYTRLGIAASNLNPDEIEELRRNDSVDTVVPNETRRIPRPVTVAEATGPHGVSGDALVTYLQGMRDAIDTVLRRLGAARPATAFMEETALPQSFTRAEPPIDSSFSWCLSLIGMSPSYQLATGSGVMVAVLDTGLDLNHPDFSGRVTEGDNGRSFISGEGVQDGHGHGTHCAGVVAGPRVSAGGRRFGVAPDANLIVGKVLNNEGEGQDDQILDGIDWAADFGAKIISMSLGSERAAGQPFATPYERVAERLLASGVLIVAAAGNESNRPFSMAAVGNPAACPSIMAVAAVDRNRQVASFSCAQLDGIGTLDISAPGVAVYSSWTGGGFRSISGTSMATPHVAGVAALYRQKNPGLSAQGIWNLLMSQAIPLGNSRDFGRGLLQVPR